MKLLRSPTHASSKDLHVTPRGMHVTPRDLSARSRVHAGQPVQLAWLPPESHDVKINADGGFSKIGDRGASAVVCRDK